MAETDATVPPPPENPFEGPPTTTSLRGDESSSGDACRSLRLVAFAVLGLSLFMSYGKKATLPIVERFLDAIETERYADAYEQISEEWRKTITFEDFKNFFAKINQSLGPHKSLSMEAYRIQVDRGVSTATAGFSVEYPTGPAFITTNLRQSNDSWRITMIRFSSDRLVTQMRCPGCGKLVSISAKFCSHCGAPLTQANEKETPAPGETKPAEEDPEN